MVLRGYGVRQVSVGSDSISVCLVNCNESTTDGTTGLDDRLSCSRLG